MATLEAIRAAKRQLGLDPAAPLKIHRTVQYQDVVVYHFTLGEEKVKVVETVRPMSHDVTVVV